MNNKLYVGGLAWAVDSKGLEDAFINYGQITEAKVITDRETGRSRGFGFVTFDNPDDAERALEMNGQEVQGRSVIVNFARSRNDRPRY